MHRIPVSASDLDGNEKHYLTDCIKTNWVSSQGPYVSRFEDEFSKYINVKYSIACSSGTTALHLGLLSLGIDDGDEVITPSFTFIATVNAILYCKAKPVFVDIDPVTWCMDSADVRRKLTAKTKAIMAVHLYGNPANIDELQQIAQKNTLFLIEDCAESLGAKYRENHVGSFGDVCCHSFYANKVITCGEGGMVSTSSRSLHHRIGMLRDQGMSIEKRYYHEMLAYNYRMTNLQAAVGLAQLERIENFLRERRRIFEQYYDLLQEMEEIVLPFIGDATRKPVNWIFTILLRKGNRNRLAQYLNECNVDTRPTFYPSHKMPYIADESLLPTTNKIAASGISLPTYTKITNEQIKYVCDVLKQYFRKAAKNV